jgi:hypothetical protein
MTDPLRSALRHHLTLDQAHSAARAGDLDQAARLLDALDAAGAATGASLDLRARIHAQQGNLPEADRCWARALLLNQDDRDAQAGRETIAGIRAGRRPRPLFTGGRAALLAAGVGTVLVGGFAWIPTSARGPAREPVAAPASVPTRPGEIERLERQIAMLEGERKAAADRRARDLAAIAAAVTMPGVRVERRADDVRVVFRAGVFRTGTTPRRDARPLLTEIGRRLATVPATTTVVGHTVVVAGGPTTGGSTLAYSRAQVAAKQLAVGGGLPLTAFTLATADQSERLFPDAARNRTVTLVLRPTRA